MKSKKIIGEIVNVGSNKKISIKDLCKKILELSNQNKKIKITFKRKRPKLSEVDQLQCNNKKIIKLLSWKPKIKLNEGLKYTIDWLKENKINKLNDYII